MHQKIEELTIINRTHESLIDVLCVSMDLIVHDLSTTDLENISDHWLFECYIEIMFDEPIESSNFRYRDLTAIDISQFNIDVNVVDKNAFTGINDSDQQVKRLNEIFCTCMINTLQLKVRESRKRSKPITHTIREMIALKNEAHKRYIKTKKFAHKEYYIDLKN
ncbi:hypothetical protein HHI36_011376 [Cryptolaemus montrouzieri]|uniref:Uncharacterized protein n=1 Tax=Cryptolaemus montrouzieri TaxID=559131 RepID=A0ABD2MLH7_9CUCU